MNKILISVGVFALALAGAAIAIDIISRKKREDDRDLTYDEIFCEECDGDCCNCSYPDCPVSAANDDAFFDEEDNLFDEDRSSDTNTKTEASEDTKL